MTRGFGVWPVALPGSAPFTNTSRRRTWAREKEVQLVVDRRQTDRKKGDRDKIHISGAHPSLFKYPQISNSTHSLPFSYDSTNGLIFS